MELSSGVSCQKLGYKGLGGKVVITTPNGVSSTFRVIDIFDSGITNLDYTRVYMHINTLQSILGKEGQINEIVIKLKDPERAERLAKVFGAGLNYEVESWQRAYRNFLSIFKIQNTITYLIVFAILLVSAFGIFNIIMMTVLEKKRDIAILMAMGYSRRDVLLIFLLQGFCRFGGCGAWLHNRLWLARVFGIRKVRRGGAHKNSRLCAI